MAKKLTKKVKYRSGGIGIAGECLPGPDGDKCRSAFDKIGKKVFTGKVIDWMKDTFSRSKSDRGKRFYDEYTSYREGWKGNKERLKDEGYTNKEIKMSIGPSLSFDQWKKGITQTEGALDVDPVTEGYYSGEEYEFMPEDIQRKRDKLNLSPQKYFQAGGITTPPSMYGPNVLPGSMSGMDTSLMVYSLSEPNFLESQHDALTELEQSDEYLEEAQATAEQRQQALATGEGILEAGTQALTGETPDVKNFMDRIKANRAGKKAAGQLAKQGYMPPSAAPPPTMITGTAPGMAPASGAPLTTTGLTTAPTGAVPINIPGAGQAPLWQPGTDAILSQASQTGVTAAKGAGHWAAGASGAGLGAAAALAGTGIRALAEDKDETRWNPGEVSGDMLSAIGTGASIGAMIGSAGSPIGTAIGAGVGALYGVGKGLFTRKKARTEEEMARERKSEEIKNLRADIRRREMGAKTYSGYDYGTDIPGTQVFAKQGGIRKTGGVKKLPGGIMKNIPGTDAVEFKGQTHDEGGIMLDQNTEVENNETMDQVNIAKTGGSKKDYFFSDYLKLGGKSFSQRHKDILEKGGKQKEIDYLARMQEFVAGRNPDTIQVKEGGMVNQYQNGGEFNFDDYISTQETGDEFRKYMHYYYPDWTYEGGKEGLDYDPTGEKTHSYDNKYIKKAFEQYGKEYAESGLGLTKEGKHKPVTITAIPPGPIEVDDPYQDAHERLLAEAAKLKETSTSTLPIKLTKEEERAINKMYRDVPGFTYAAGAAQMIPASYAFLKKPTPAEQAQVPGAIKAPDLERVSFNAERAANAAQNRAMNRFIETSGGGPANIISKMAAYSKKQQGDMQIAGAEARANTAIANTEAGLRFQAQSENMKNLLATDQFNVQLRDLARREQEDRKLMALDTMAQNIAGLGKDVLAYKGTERLARATGDMGIYERDRLRQSLMRIYLSQGLSQDEANKRISAIIPMAETNNEEQES